MPAVGPPPLRRPRILRARDGAHYVMIDPVTDPGAWIVEAVETKKY